MGRRSDHTRAELHDLVLSAAQAIVERKGLSALTARSVAQKIGYSPGTIYNLFENVDELILRLNAGTMDSLCAALGKVRLSGKVEEDLMALMRAYLRFVDRNRNAWDAVLEHSLPEGQPSPPWMSETVSRAVKILESALAPLFGPTQARERKRVASILWAAVHGLVVLGKEGNLKAITDDSAGTLAGSLIAYLSAGVAAVEAKGT